MVTIIEKTGSTGNGKLFNCYNIKGSVILSFSIMGKGSPFKTR